MWYTFWQGWNLEDKLALALLFMKTSGRKVCCVRVLSPLLWLVGVAVAVRQDPNPLPNPFPNPLPNPFPFRNPNPNLIPIPKPKPKPKPKSHSHSETQTQIPFPFPFPFPFPNPNPNPKPPSRSLSLPMWMQALVVVQKTLASRVGANDYFGLLGFQGVELADAVAVKMAGSESLAKVGGRVYVYVFGSRPDRAGRSQSVQRVYR